jgi:MoxR-like ATPase
MALTYCLKNPLCMEAIESNSKGVFEHESMSRIASRNVTNCVNLHSRKFPTNRGYFMKPSKLYEALHALIGERVPLHIWGACGVGKSQIVAQVASDLDYDFLDIRAVQLDPVDLRGLPRIAEDQTEWVPPKFLPTTGKGILFLDELTSAPQMTQAGCYQLVLDRKLGEYLLPDGWVVIAAGNPASERGVHFAMPRPLRNRFVHLDLEPDLDDWCRWAVKAQVRSEIIAFLRFKPDLLHTADATSDANAWPTPRSWEMASQVLCGIARRQKTQFLSGASEFEAQLLDGTVGPAAASELVAFIRLFRQLPSIDEILLNPTTAPLPTEPSAQIAIATALGRAMSDTSVGRGIAYLDRMPTEMRVMAMRDAAARDTAITHTPEFVRFGVAYREVIQ